MKNHTEIRHVVTLDKTIPHSLYPPTVTSLFDFNLATSPGFCTRMHVHTFSPRGDVTEDNNYSPKVFHFVEGDYSLVNVYVHAMHACACAWCACARVHLQP